jgi:mannobiose 2-epimerase
MAASLIDPGGSPFPTAKDFEAALRQHVLDVWFPRCLDTEHGGFLSDFDRAWKPAGKNDKLLEFQARQTLTAADALALFPDDARLRQATEHGFRYLGDVMWDPDAGGWFHRMDRGGRMLEAETKHAHGAAYAIEACAAVYVATGDPSALELARKGFEWLERYARDPEQRGYFGFLTRGNRVIREPSQCPYPAQTDTIGTLIGLKDANVHSDLVETFTNLYRVWPDPLVGERLAETVDLVSDRMVVAATGAMHIFVTADWIPIPHLSRAGYQCQTAWRFLAARSLLSDDARLERLAAKMTDHLLRYFKDEASGGFFYAAPGAEPAWLGGQSLVVRDKPWWIQAEAVKVLVAMTRLRPDEARYRTELERQWAYVHAQCFDPQHGGMFACSLDRAPRWRRALGAGFAPPKVGMKGDVWKDASHDGRAWMYGMAE